MRATVLPLLCALAAPAAGAPPRPPAPTAIEVTDEEKFWSEAARAAWRYTDAHHMPATGFVGAVGAYPYGTVWDIASGLAALHCARELGLVSAAVHEARTRAALKTLRRLQLFDGAAFNKFYSLRSGVMVGRDNRLSRRGHGWSAMDLGRLLLWLKIVATRHPVFADDATAVVGRLVRERVVGDGYLRGATLGSGGKVSEYQEGRVGYEQYSARGFAAWGFDVPRALDLRANAIPLEVMGQTLLADVRGKDRLTSEPFLLAGLETGWDPAMKELSQRVLAAQEERYRRTGQVTIASEDAIDRPPHYFFYYSLYAGGLEFTPDVQSPTAVVDAPHWVSAKAALAWRALLPGDYTRKAIETVARAWSPRGWASGVYERTGRSTGTPNVNTQAVILEAAVFRARGRPLLDPAP